MIFEAGTQYLLAVVKILGANEANDRVDEHGGEVAGNGIRARLAGLLIDAVMRIRRERASLAGFEIHHVLTNRAASKFRMRPVSLQQAGRG